jgi:hypothetical protein
VIRTHLGDMRTLSSFFAVHQSWMQRSVTSKYLAVFLTVHSSGIVNLFAINGRVLHRGSMAGNSKHPLGMNDFYSRGALPISCTLRACDENFRLDSVRLYQLELKPPQK